MSRKVRLRIRYDRGRGLAALLALALLAAAFLGCLAWNRGEAAAAGPQAPAPASPASSANMRRYYLTKTSRNGVQALAACARGYHMASLWEIVDPSHLKYNTSRGSTEDDSGQGPPGYWGWVRTGAGSSNIQAPGIGNCNAWTSSSASDYGTIAQLPHDWLSEPDFDLWHVGFVNCSQAVRIWCVADAIPVPVYLPLTVRNSS
jgi:hypothetical protein